MYCPQLFNLEDGEDTYNPRLIIGDDLSRSLGFDPSKVTGSYYFNGKTVIIAYIRSLHPRQGNIKQLYSDILSRDYTLIVALPCEEMKNLCESMGMKYWWGHLPEYGEPIDYYWA